MVGASAQRLRISRKGNRKTEELQMAPSRHGFSFTAYGEALRLLSFLLVMSLSAATYGQLSAVSRASQTTPLRIEGDHFTLHGRPFQILSGELEYARIPRADWRDRLRKVHALGLNSITVYVFWNLHEPTPGVYDFTGQNDVAEFLREAQQEGLYVVLRPGPYVCAEWDLGGYPAWLLKNPAMLLRSSEPTFQLAARVWMLRLGKELAGLQASRGGPILAVQVENEYGSFDVQEDRSAYLNEVHQMVLDAGFGESLLYTADGGDVLAKGSIPGLLAAVDYGTGDADRSLALLKKFEPGAPVFAAEYWDGWFDHWGEKHQVTDAIKQEAEIRAVIASGHSINLYMVHGGTTFGWMNGANSGRSDGPDGLNTGSYQPDVSSYDYDAPIDEAGRLRPKYFALRTMIAAVTHHAPPAVPESGKFLTLPEMRLTESRSMWSALPSAIYSDSLRSMEDLDQTYGYLLYRTQVPDTGSGKTHSTLAIDGLHSYARIYLDGQFAGIFDRRLGTEPLEIITHPGQELSILVDNTGRINFTTALRGERAGILGNVRLNGHRLDHWQSFPLPLQQAPAGGFTRQACTGPCFYRGDFELTALGDTYLDTTKLGKGVIWVNGHLLGRFWNVGPMGSLFLPGAWLHRGSNSITVLDWNGGTAATLNAGDHALYTQPKPESTGHTTPPTP
jgi:beta-galactosidase